MKLGAKFMKRRLQLMAPHAGEMTRAEAIAHIHEATERVTRAGTQTPAKAKEAARAMIAALPNDR